jgi:hypothetical protein
MTVANRKLSGVIAGQWGRKGSNRTQADPEL